MKHHLTEQEQQRLDARIAEAEKRTGSQIVLAVIGRCDDYPELPWKAFALAAAAAGFAAVLLDRLPASWHGAATTHVAVAATLIAGAGAALLTVLVPSFARLFLDRHRREAEVRQYAESLFLKRQLFGTEGRTGILVLVSLFERQVVVLPDTGLATRLGRDALAAVIGPMTASLAAGRVSAALELGLSGLEAALAKTAPPSPGTDALPDAIVQEDGP